jgi:hypothetical protein
LAIGRVSPSIHHTRGAKANTSRIEDAAEKRVSFE